MEVSSVAQLLHSHISEDQLNSYIRSTKDWDLLRVCLELKAHLISENKQVPLDFELDYILTGSLHYDINKMCPLLRYGITIQSSNTEFLKLLKSTNKSLVTNFDGEDLQSLKLLDLMLSLCDTEQRRTAFIEFTMLNNFDATISGLLTSDSQRLVNFVSVYILPNYLKICSSGSSLRLLKAIWKKALQSRQLNLLCSTVEFMLPIDPISNEEDFSLVDIDRFWFELQNSLNDRNSYSKQAQGLFLLKRTVEIIKRGNIVPKVKTSILGEEVHEKIQVINALENFITLIEVSKEKQLHLIEPSYHLLSTITILHFSWLMCIYKMLLNHSHSAVNTFAILDIIKSSWYCNDTVDVFKIVVGDFLPALNSNDNVEKIEIWEELHKFVHKLDNTKFVALLEESTKISWIPSVSYQFYKNILRQDRKFHDIPLELVQRLIDNAIKLPHKFIRNGCADIIRNFAKRMLINHETTLKNYLALIAVLYKDQPAVRVENNDLEYCKKFITNIEKEIITTWSNSEINLKEAQILFSIAPLFSNNWLVENTLKKFHERRFHLVVLDWICVLLYSRRLINYQDLCKYVDDRLVSSKNSTDITIRKILSLVVEEIDDETCLNVLVNKSTRIILNKGSTVDQREMAFQLVTLTLRLDTNRVSKDSINDIIVFWKGTKSSSSFIYVTFLIASCNSENYADSSSSNFILGTLKMLEDMLELENNDVIADIFIQLKYILDKFHNAHSDALCSFVELCFMKLSDMKGREIFKIAIKNFTKSIFTNSKISNDNLLCYKIVDISWQLLEIAKTCDDAAYNLVKYLHELSCINTQTTAQFIPILVDLLLFGTTLKKDERAEYIACQQIHNNRNQAIDETNPNFRKQYIRSQTVIIVNNILNGPSVTTDEKIKRADELISLLIDKYNVYLNKRYFTDSNIHLQKLRIVQALLLTHNNVKDQKEPLIELLTNSLCTESHQVSVKIFIQWILIMLLHDAEECLSIITSKMESTSKVHSSTIIAFVPILYHIAVFKNNEEFCMKLFKIMLPWTMGAHFNLRLFAQEGLIKLYELACENNFHQVIDNFKYTRDSILEVLEKTERKITTLDRYIFDQFKPVDHFHLQTIYFNIPKITKNVTPVEYENILSIKEFNTSKNEEFIDQYFSVELKESSVKSYGNTNVFQRKIIPSMEPLFEPSKERRTGELIVVASLIDKVPNLAGLTRTCEIFGVDKLLMNNISVVTEQQFKSVSVSSENWVELLQIKVGELQSYLLETKEKGYSIVGVEQTSDSVLLNVFQFPKRCLVLLGNEKEGIPPNLLALVDFCVEIPQYGVVRSLNVHVAASTVIWEYTKQHVAS